MNGFKGILSWLDQLIQPPAALPESERRRVKLLAWILLSLILFCMAILFIMLIFNPEQDPWSNQYALLIISLVAFSVFLYGLNHNGHYLVSAALLVACAALMPWASLVLDPSIIMGDFVPLTYATFSVLMSSILLPLYITFPLAVLQFTGLLVALLLNPVTPSFNWFSFLAFIFLNSVFSILANGIIQHNMKEINAQAHQLALDKVDLREQSIRDYLTGLFNRRYMEETLEREIQRAKRSQTPLSIIILDVDDFKHINDTGGHAKGDWVLRELGKFLMGRVRQSDIACRYGGDEFVLVLPDATRDISVGRAGQLREGVKPLFMNSKDHDPIAITISVGVAVFPEDGASSEAILKSADDALYRAKNKG